MDKIIFEDLPSQNTPINAESLNKLQENIETAIEQRITTGQEFATNEYIDGKRVYRFRADLGNLPNAEGKIVNINLDTSKITMIRLQGCAEDNTTTMCLPYATPYDNNSGGVSVDVQKNNKIYIYTILDRSAFSGYIDLYYTKN